MARDNSLFIYDVPNYKPTCKGVSQPARFDDTGGYMHHYPIIPESSNHPYETNVSNHISNCYDAIFKLAFFVINSLFNHLHNHHIFTDKDWLVVSTLLKNLSSSVGMIIPYFPNIWKKSCSKPPTSYRYKEVL